MQNNSSPKYDAFVMARMSSNRIPGKALRSLCGKPLIMWAIETLRECSVVKDVILTTSDDSTDDDLVEFAESIGLKFFRGSLNNAADRFLKAMHVYDAQAGFRVNGDSPLVNRHLLKQAAATFQTDKFDLVTNVFPRTYPPGMSVELIRRSAFARACSSMKAKEDLEHVTTYLYRNSSHYRVTNISSEIQFDQIHLAVDTNNDWDVVEALLKSLARPHWDYMPEEIVSKYGAIST